MGRPINPTSITTCATCVPVPDQKRRTSTHAISFWAHTCHMHSSTINMPSFVWNNLLLALPVVLCASQHETSVKNRNTKADDTIVYTPILRVAVKVNRQMASPSSPIWVDPDMATVVHWYLSCSCHAKVRSPVDHLTSPSICCNGYAPSSAEGPSVTFTDTASGAIVTAPSQPYRNETRKHISCKEFTVSTL